MQTLSIDFAFIICFSPDKVYPTLLVNGMNTCTCIVLYNFHGDVTWSGYTKDHKRLFLRFCPWFSSRRHGWKAPHLGRQHLALFHLPCLSAGRTRQCWDKSDKPARHTCVSYKHIYFTTTVLLRGLSNKFFRRSFKGFSCSPLRLRW